MQRNVITVIDVPFQSTSKVILFYVGIPALENGESSLYLNHSRISSSSTVLPQFLKLSNIEWQMNGSLYMLSSGEL
jgi:hypothetical protein